LVVPESLETFVHLKVFYSTHYKHRIRPKWHDVQSQIFVILIFIERSESKTNFRKNRYLISIKTGISAVQTSKEKSTIIKQQNAYTNCHLHIDNCFKTIKLLHVSSFRVSSSGQVSSMYEFRCLKTNMIMSVKCGVKFFG